MQVTLLARLVFVTFKAFNKRMKFEKKVIVTMMMTTMMLLMMMMMMMVYVSYISNVAGNKRQRAQFNECKIGLVYKEK